MTLAEREFILQNIHAQAEQSYRESGWKDEPHGVYIHAFTAEVLVGELIRERQRVRQLEDRLARLGA